MKQLSKSMPTNVMGYLKSGARYVLSDSSDEGEILCKRKLKKPKVKDANLLVSTKDFPVILERKFEENIHAEFIYKDVDILKKKVRKNFAAYSNKFKELILRQATELADVKKKYINSLTDELEDWKKYNVQLKYHEDKLHRVLKKLGNNYKLMRTENNKFTKILEMHKAFYEEHEELMNKHEAETAALNKFVNDEIENTKME